MSRGDQRNDIFLGDVDRYDFTKTLAEGCLKTGWLVHAQCLMKNQLPFGHRDAQRQPGRGDGPVAKHLHH